ncbi:coiled-coil domain-containing protein 149-like [Oppia nitens]|uniref:coiled-coil domain-containing protein 149-like n=1 Tax=Oppia nitens TaxID=1686743 RepID=UPI0023DCAF18|nr:coiled-coil domain-containing protein 149-like [Oppia nitens]
MSDKKIKSVPTQQFDAALNEIQVLREKLDSKSCALIILSQELLECKAQKDQFKLMGEQLRERYAQVKRKMEGLGPTLSNVYDYEYDMPRNSANCQQTEPLGQLLITMKEQNKHLIREIDDLRMKLEDAEGDLKIVRGQMRTMSQHIDSAAYESRDRNNIDMNVIQELEFYKNKVVLLERDLQSVLDEKEELILSRDSYKLKVDRLNEKLNDLMRNELTTGTASRASGGSVTNDGNNGSGPGGGMANTMTDNRIFDIDQLFMENRYLQEKLKTYDEEKRLLTLRLTKYKEILDKKRMNANKLSPQALRNSLSSTGQTLAGINVITARQIEELIATDAINNMDVTATNLLQLKNLVIALFDGLQDKSVSLSHAKRTNKILGKRVEELETQVRCLRSATAKDKMPIMKTESLESNTSSNTTTSASNQDDLATPDDDLVGDEDEIEDRDSSSTPIDDRDVNEDDDELPPELDRLVKEAINELKIRDLEEPIGQTVTSKTIAKNNDNSYYSISQ